MAIRIALAVYILCALIMSCGGGGASVDEGPGDVSIEAASAWHLSLNSVSSPRPLAGSEGVVYRATAPASSDEILLASLRDSPQEETPSPPQPLIREGLPVRWFAPSPVNSDVIVFGRPEASNSGHDQIYQLTISTNTETLLTTNPLVRHNEAMWSPDASSLVFSANINESHLFDIYVYSFDTKEQLLLVDGTPGSLLKPLDFSPDGKSLLFAAYSDLNVNSLWIVDIETKEKKAVTPEGARKRYWPASWSSDPQKIYVVSHEDDGQPLSFASLDVDTKKLETLISSEWAIEFFSQSEDRKNIFLVYNENGESVPYWYNIDRGARTIIEDLPKGGVISSASFLNNSQEIVLDWESPRTRRAIYSYSSSGFQLVARPQDAEEDENFIDARLFSFEARDGTPINGYVYIPQNEKGPSPLLVRPHGGPESQSRPYFSSSTQFFIAQGWAVYYPNVRGSTGYGQAFADLDNVEKRENAIHDLVDGVDSLISEGSVDASRLALMGGSYGGYIVLGSLTLYPERFVAGVSHVGISNFVTFLEGMAPAARRIREVEYGSLEKSRALLESLSPIHRADRINAPVLLIHGKNDPIVSVNESIQIYDKLDARLGTDPKMRPELIIYEDEGHQLLAYENRLNAQVRIGEFLARAFQSSRSDEEEGDEEEGDEEEGDEEEYDDEEGDDEEYDEEEGDEEEYDDEEYDDEDV